MYHVGFDLLLLNIVRYQHNAWRTIVIWERKHLRWVNYISCIVKHTCIVEIQFNGEQKLPGLSDFNMFKKKIIITCGFLLFFCGIYRFLKPISVHQPNTIKTCQFLIYILHSIPVCSMLAQKRVIKNDIRYIPGILH